MAVVGVNDEKEGFPSECEQVPWMQAGVAGYYSVMKICTIAPYD